MFQSQDLRVCQLSLVEALPIFCACTNNVQSAIGHDFSAGIDSKGHFGVFCCVSEIVSADSWVPTEPLTRFKTQSLLASSLSLYIAIQKTAIIAGHINVGIIVQVKVEVEGSVPGCTHHGRIRPFDSRSSVFISIVIR